MAHQTQQFEVIVSIGSPHPIASYLMKPLQPLIQSNPDMLTTSLGIEGAILDLLADEMVLNLFGSWIGWAG